MTTACQICKELYFGTYDHHITNSFENESDQNQFVSTSETDQDFLTAAASTILNLVNMNNYTETDHSVLYNNITDGYSNSSITLNGSDNDTFYIFYNMSNSNFTHNLSSLCNSLTNNSQCPEFLGNGTQSFSDIFYVHILPQIILAFMAILLNAAEIYMMRKKKKYYPSEYLMVSLAVADFMFSILVVVAQTVFSATFNSDLTSGDVSFTRQLFLEIIDTLIGFSVFASIVHVVAISMDRLVAVFLPLRHRVRTDAIKMKRIVIGIWCLTVIFIGSLSAYQYRGGINEEAHESSRRTSKIISVLMFVAAALVAVIYMSITRKLAIQANFLHSLQSSSGQKNAKKRPHGNLQKRRSKRSKIEMVALVTAGVITVAFLACTLPYACLHFVLIVSETMETVFLCLLICNSICNPLVYFWRGYWLKTKRERKRVATMTTAIEDSSSSSAVQKTLNSMAQSVGVAFIPIRANMTGLRKSKNKKYNLSSDMTVLDIFDFDSISRFRRFERSYYNQGRQFNDSHHHRVDLSSL